MITVVLSEIRHLKSLVYFDVSLLSRVEFYLELKIISELVKQLLS